MPHIFRHDTTNNIYLKAIEYPSKFRTTGYSYSKLYTIDGTKYVAFTEPYKSGTLQTQLDLMHTYINETDGTQGFSDPVTNIFNCTRLDVILNIPIYAVEYPSIYGNVGYSYSKLYIFDNNQFLGRTVDYTTGTLQQIESLDHFYDNSILEIYPQLGDNCGRSHPMTLLGETKSTI